MYIVKHITLTLILKWSIPSKISKFYFIITIVISPFELWSSKLKWEAVHKKICRKDILPPILFLSMRKKIVVIACVSLLAYHNFKSTIVLLHHKYVVVPNIPGVQLHVIFVFSLQFRKAWCLCKWRHHDKTAWWNDNQWLQMGISLVCTGCSKWFLSIIYFQLE